MSTSGGGGKGGANPSVYDQSANAFRAAGGAASGANQIYNNVRGYNPAQMTPAQAAMPSTIASGMDRYFNPYTDEVINRSIMDVNRITDMQQDRAAAAASGVGAFGGSRQGVVEALTNSEGQKNIGDLAAGLRSEGFNTAAGLSAQDIANTMAGGQFNAGLLQQGRLANQGALNEGNQFNINTALARAQGLSGLSGLMANLGETGFGIGQTITGDQMNAGSLQQQLMQQILGRAGGQYDQFMGMPQNLLNMQLSALGMNPLTTATTTTGQYKPGLLDWAGLAAQGLGAWRLGS